MSYYCGKKKLLNRGILPFGLAAAKKFPYNQMKETR